MLLQGIQQRAGGEVSSDALSPDDYVLTEIKRENKKCRPLNTHKQPFLKAIDNKLDSFDGLRVLNKQKMMTRAGRVFYHSRFAAFVFNRTSLSNVSNVGMVSGLQVRWPFLRS